VRVGHLRLGGLIAHAIGVVGVLAYAWWASGLRPFSHAALAATVSAGLVAIAVGARRRMPVLAPRPRAGEWVWRVLLGALAAWELASFLQHPRADHPTLSSLVNGLLGDQPSRALAFLAWLCAGAYLSRR
jgi:hypothetical protein